MTKKVNQNLRFNSKDEFERFLLLIESLKYLSKQEGSKLFFVSDISDDPNGDYYNILKLIYLERIKLVKEETDFGENIYLII